MITHYHNQQPLQLYFSHEFTGKETAKINFDIKQGKETETFTIVTKDINTLQFIDQLQASEAEKQCLYVTCFHCQIVDYFDEFLWLIEQ